MYFPFGVTLSWPFRNFLYPRFGFFTPSLRVFSGTFAAEERVVDLWGAMLSLAPYVVVWWRKKVESKGERRKKKTWRSPASR